MVIIFLCSKSHAQTIPVFTTEPTNQIVLAGSNVTFNAAFTGAAPIHSQWFFNTEALPRATNLTLTITNAQPADEGNYSIKASNFFGTATSFSAFLDVVDLTEALGDTNLVWRNSSATQWYPELTKTRDGVAAAEIILPYGKQSLLQTSIMGPGTLTFWWLVPSYGVSLTLTLDGITVINPPSGSLSVWTPNTLYIAEGNHVFTWTAESTSFSGGGSSSAYLDSVEFATGTTPSAILFPPRSVTNAAGSNVTLRVTASGTPPISYQWHFNGNTISGATATYLTITNIQSGNAGTYWVVADNGYGSAQSSNATLTVIPSAPIFSIQPVDIAVFTNGQATFTASAYGSAPINYQWNLNGSPISSATNLTLTITNAQDSDSGLYSLTASNAIGFSETTNATLLVYNTADFGAALDTPAIIWSTTNVLWFPETNITHYGNSAAQSGFITNSQQSTLQGIVSGPATITYWWKVNCDSFWDALAFSLNGTIQNSITGALDWQQATNYIGAGSQVLQWSVYPVHGAFAGGTGWLDQVQVIPGGTAPAITANPLNVANNAGNNVSFTVSAIGTPPLRYQWNMGGTNIPGATNAMFALTNIQSVNAGTYAVTVTNDFDAADSSNAVLVVNSVAPIITTQPSPQSKVLRSTVKFNVAAKGSAPLSYQWYFNSAPIAKATDTTLSIPDLQPANAGAYQVIVTNNIGAVTSSVAMMEVSPAIVVDLWPIYANSYPTPFGLTNVIAVAAGASHTLALRQGRTVAIWGNNDYGQTNVPAGLSNVLAIAAGAYHSVALAVDGTVACWGDNTYGQLYVPNGLSNVAAIAASAYDTYALKSNGTVVAWGRDDKKQSDVPAGLTNLQAVAGSLYNGFAINLDGTLTQWGDIGYVVINGTIVDLDFTRGVKNVAQIAVGEDQSWTLQNDGSVFNWGVFQAEIFKDSVVALSATGDSGFDEYLFILKDDGTVVSKDSGSNVTPLLPTNFTNVAAISAGYDHGVALVSDGSPHTARTLLNQTAPSASTVYFRSGVVGATPLHYQWQFNGDDLSGATNAVLTLTNVSLAVAGKYGCEVTNALGVAYDAPTTLYITRSTPSFGAGTFVGGTGFKWQLNNLSGHGPIIVETSSNLVDWLPILTNAPVTGSFQFLDSDTTNHATRFYRAVEQ